MREFSKRIAQLLGMTLAVLLVCIPAFSQANLGRLSGTVTDESGGTMAGAKVSVIDQARGISRDLKTDEAGAYAAPSLTPGMYTVRVEATGFNTTERKDIQIPVGGDIRADMAMKAGSQTQTVTVTEALPLINTTSATLGGVMQGNEVQDLPLIAHNYQTLLQFQPGVVSKPGGGANAHSSNGARSDGNNWLFEGLFTGGVRTAGIIVNQNSSTGDGASIVPPDAIQEMGISFQNKAEYGWKPGVASNVGVKSGTNGIHGTAFAVGQTDKLNARNPFNPAPNPKPELNYEQYGATIGGPIKKDKLFYFVGFEGLRFTQGTPTTHLQPTTGLIAGNPTLSIPAAYLDLAARTGGANGGYGTGCATGATPSCSTINPAAIDANGKVVDPSKLTPQQALSYQLANSGIFPSDLGNGAGTFNTGFVSQRDPSKNIVGKIDYHLSDKHQISGVYFWSKDTEIGDSQAATQQWWTGDFYLTANVVRFNWTYLPSSTLVNEFHFGFDRKIENQWATECRPGRTVPPPSTPNYVFNTGAQGCFGGPDPSAYAFPNLTIAGFDPTGNTSAQRRVEGYPAWADNVSYTRGNHNLKFGFETRHPYWSGGAYSGKKGAITFGTTSSSTLTSQNAFTVSATNNATPLESFLLGFPSTASVVAGDPGSTRRNWAYGTFIQDDWRITPRFTINLGMRWEYQSALTEDKNLEAVFDPNTLTGLRQLGDGIKEVWHPSFFGNNLQPRAGLVWDVSGKGTTVVRAAWGVYSNWPVWSVLQNLGTNPTGATFFKKDGTSIQGTGSILTTSISFPTQSNVAGPSNQLHWSNDGQPLFQAGIPKCGDNQVLTTTKKNPGTCAIGAIDPNWQVPLMQEWTIGIQRAIGSKMSLDASYVGSHGSKLFGTTDLNMPGIGASSSSSVQTRRPYWINGLFPWMGNISEVVNRDYSNYNALQLTLNQRAWHGVTSTLGYTYAHALDVAATDLAQAIHPDASCPSCNYGPTPFDIRHRMTARVTYDIPSVKGYAQMLEGWSVSTVLNLQGATPWAVADASSNFSGTGKAERWNIFGNAKDFNKYGQYDAVPCYSIKGASLAIAGGCANIVNTYAELPQACREAAESLQANPLLAADKNATGKLALTNTGCYQAAGTNSVIVPPSQGTFGNMGKGIFRSSAFKNLDISVRKNIHIMERLNAQFSFDMYNATNTPHFAIPGGNGNTSTNDLTTPAGFGRSVATPNVSNGNVVGGSGDARRYQFGLKLLF